MKLHTRKRKTKGRRRGRTLQKRKIRKTRKTLKGGFLSEASYYANKIDSFFSVDPTPPFGNTSIPVPFF